MTLRHALVLAGAPCTSDGASCGSEACQKAPGFCHVLTCKGGTWHELEVPPPPPPH